jgi:IS30 family transposase
MVAWIAIGLPGPIKSPGVGRCVPSFASCLAVLSRTVSIKLRQQWSPEQIAGWLKRTYPEEPQNQVSHETIYRSLFVQARGVLKKELLEHLRAKRTIRRSKHASLK